MDKQSLTRLKINTYSNYALLFVRMLVSIITIPWLLKGFGEVGYGVFTLAFGLLASFSFLELGAGKTILRFGGEYRADQNKEKFREAVNVAINLIVYATGALVLILLLIAVFHRQLFTISDLSFEESLAVFLLATGFGAIVFFEIITTNLLHAFEKFWQRNILLFIKTLLLLLLAFMVVNEKFGLVHYAGFVLAVEVLFFAGDWVLIKRNPRIPSLGFRILSITNLRQSATFKYAVDVFLISIISTLSQNADKLIISLFLDIRFVAIYVILTKPFFIFKSLTNGLFTALQPVLIKLNQENKDVFKKTVVSFIQIPIIIFLPLTFFTIYFLEDLFRFWLGDAYQYETFVFWGKVALFALIPRLLISIPNRVLLLTGITYPVKRAEYFFTLTNVVLSVVITLVFQTIGGVIIGTLVQFSLGALYFLALLNQYFDIRIRDVFSNSILGFILTVIVIFLFAWIFIAGIPNQHLLWIMLVVLAGVAFVDVIFLKKLKLLRYLI